LRGSGWLAALWLAGAALSAQADPAPAPGRSWEVNGIRLEPGQVERLAADMAKRTVEAVETRVPDIALADSQREQMLEIYRGVSLGVYDRVVHVVGRDDLEDAAKEEQVRELVLAGQRESHAQLEKVLDARQLELYSAWESRQVEAFKSRRWDRRKRRRR
jgi:hypothetical protein